MKATDANDEIIEATASPFVPSIIFTPFVQADKANTKNNIAVNELK